jgi:hypothetical protein
MNVQLPAADLERALIKKASKVRDQYTIDMFQI